MTDLRKSDDQEIKQDVDLLKTEKSTEITGEEKLHEKIEENAQETLGEIEDVLETEQSKETQNLVTTENVSKESLGEGKVPEVNYNKGIKDVQSSTTKEALKEVKVLVPNTTESSKDLVNVEKLPSVKAEGEFQKAVQEEPVEKKIAKEEAPKKEPEEKKKGGFFLKIWRFFQKLRGK